MIIQVQALCNYTNEIDALSPDIDNSIAIMSFRLCPTDNLNCSVTIYATSTVILKSTAQPSLLKRTIPTSLTTKLSWAQRVNQPINGTIFFGKATRQYNMDKRNGSTTANETYSADVSGVLEVGGLNRWTL
jgi:hypothetical protein